MYFLNMEHKNKILRGKYMRFRIEPYYDRYSAKVFIELEGWTWIGSPTGYKTVQEAKDFCVKYKKEIESKIIEEFEL